MDMVDDLREELECGICMELYKEPKTLPCIHSFCRICLVRHILSQKTLHERTKSFLCPFCRYEVRIPRTQDPIETWANQLPNNTHIPSIIGRLENSKRTSCVFHPSETVSSFCKVCSILACGQCLQERHPSCTGEAFSTIREMGLERKKDLQSNAAMLNAEMHRVTEEMNLMASVISGLGDAEAETIEQVEEQANLSVEAIEETENKLLKQLEQMVQGQLFQLKRIKHPNDEAADIVQNYKSGLEEIMKSSTGSNFLDNLEVINTRKQSILEEIGQLRDQCSAPEILFVETGVPSPTIGKLVPSTDPSFQIDISPETSHQPPPPKRVLARKESPLLAYLNAVRSPISPRQQGETSSEACTQAL